MPFSVFFSCFILENTRLIRILIFFRRCKRILYTRKYFCPGYPYIDTQPLEIIYLDLCVMDHISIGGSKFVFYLVDDYTRMCWVYLLKNKYDAFQTFKNLHTWIENDAQFHIGSIRTDNGK